MELTQIEDTIQEVRALMRRLREIEAELIRKATK